MKFLAPYLLKTFLNKQAQKFNQGFNPNTTSSKKEGDVDIKSSSSKSTSNKNIGEYVEYEEVEDK